MRLLQWSRGRLVIVRTPDTAQEIEHAIRNLATISGDINRLVLDFSGVYVPLVSTEDARLASALIVAYQGTDIAHQTHDTVTTVCIVSFMMSYAELHISNDVCYQCHYFHGVQPQTQKLMRILSVWVACMCMPYM